MSIFGSTWDRFEVDTVTNAIVPLRRLCTLSTASPSWRASNTSTVISPPVSCATRSAKKWWVSETGCSGACSPFSFSSIWACAGAAANSAPRAVASVRARPSDARFHDLMVKPPPDGSVVAGAAAKRAPPGLGATLCDERKLGNRPGQAARESPDLDRRRPGHGGAFGEALEPSGEPRPRRAPVLVGGAEGEVAERAADGDGADVDRVAEGAGLVHEAVEGTAEFQLLGIDPFRPAPLLRPQKGLVAGEHPGIHDAVALGLPTQGGPARRSGGRKHLRAVVQAVQILADHARIVERRAVVGDQAGHLAERIVPDQIGVRLDGRHQPGDRLDPVLQAGLDHDRHDLAHERRRAVVVQLRSEEHTSELQSR